MGVKITDLVNVETLLAADSFPCVQSGTTKEVTAAILLAYIKLDFTNAGALDPVVDTTEFTCSTGAVVTTATAQVLADYIEAEIFEDATAQDPALAADKILCTQAGAVSTLTATVLGTYILSNAITPSDALIDTILDLTNLDEDASIAGSEYMLVGTGATPKWALLSTIAAYVHDNIVTYFDAKSGLASGTIADADELFVSDGPGTPQNIPASQFATYVEGKASANICEDVWDNAGAAQTPVDADVFVMEVSGSRKKVTATLLYDYIVAEFASEAAVDGSANDSDKFLFFDSTTLKTATGTVLATYVGDKVAALTSAASKSSASGTDDIMISRSNAMEALDIAALVTYVFTQSALGTTVQSSVLDIDGLSAASLDGTEYIYVMDGTPKQQTLDNIATFIHNDATAGIAAYVGDQADADPIVDTDLFMVDRSDAVKYISAIKLAEYVRDEIIEDVNNWKLIPDANYTDTPASTSRLTMSDTTGMAVGLPLKYTISGSDDFGIVSAVSVNSYIDVRGAQLGNDVTALYVGAPQRAVTKKLTISGAYLTPWCMPDNDANADGANDSEIGEADMLAEIAREYFDWRGPTAYLVSVAVIQRTADGGANEPYFNIYVGGSLVLSENSSKGIQVVTGTWTKNSAVEVSTLDYQIAEGEAVEVRCTAPIGCTGDGSDVSLELTFVYK